MSVKRILDYASLIVDGDMSASITSDATNILYMDRVGYQISYTGTPTGTFSIEVSNDGVIWQAMTLSAAIAATGAAGNDYVDVETSARLVRLKYTRSSGSGTLNAHIVGKSISG